MTWTTLHFNPKTKKQNKNKSLWSSNVNKRMSNVEFIFHGLIGKGTKFNETVNLACANEFVVNGTNSTDVQLRCRENGTWEEFPGCVVSHCKPSDLIAIQGTILAHHSLQAK